MTSSRALGVYVPGHTWGVGQPFSSRIPPAASIRTPQGIADLIPAEQGGWLKGTLTTMQVRKGGIGCLSCAGGMGSVSTDFQEMIHGTASMSTYALYGGGLIVAMMILRSLGGRRR